MGRGDRVSRGRAAPCVEASTGVRPQLVGRREIRWAGGRWVRGTAGRFDTFVEQVCVSSVDGTVGWCPVALSRVGGPWGSHDCLGDRTHS